MPKLEFAQKRQLERWIGSGPKSFSLLYSFSRDGASAPTFHRLCDDKGPTVTVLYNTEGSIYGGFSDSSWKSTGMVNPNPKAFLFLLALSGKATFDKFPNRTGTCGTYCNESYGPTFGGNVSSHIESYGSTFRENVSSSAKLRYRTARVVKVAEIRHENIPTGHDLYTFNGTLSLQGDRYTLNGSTNFGCTYDMKGRDANLITNNAVTVYDLEVYSVSDPTIVKEWRKTSEWNIKFLRDLKEEVEQYAPPKQLELKATNILLLGPVGAGKSSFFNTIASVFRGHVTGQACSGSAEQSITSKYRMYSIRQNLSGEPLRFRLCDTRGLEESKGIDITEISYILDGHIPAGFQFSDSTCINPDVHGFVKSPSLNDKIHCVCFVIDGSTVDTLSDKMLEKIKAIKSRIHQKGIPQLVLATKVDKVCNNVEEDTSSVFKSNVVYEIVENISQILGFPTGHVLPMKNYEREIETSDDINTLALLSLRLILRATEDYMFNCLDNFEDLSLGSEDSKHS